MKPRLPLSTSLRCRQAREHMGLSKWELAKILRLGGGSPKHGSDTIRRIEQGQTPPGPYQVALEALLTGWRPS